MTDSRGTTIAMIKPGLLLIDNQVGFTHPTYWGKKRSNLSYEQHISLLISAFRDQNHPIFHVQHHSVNPASPLNPVANPSGAEFFDFARPVDDEPVFIKSVNSGFIGTNLEEAIRKAGIKTLVIAGLTIDHCVSTTTRMAANLKVVDEDGHIYIVGDAVATWEREQFDAEVVHQVHLASLSGEFSEIVTTKEVIMSL